MLQHPALAAAVAGGPSSGSRNARRRPDAQHAGGQGPLSSPADLSSWRRRGCVLCELESAGRSAQQVPAL
jgi:hypothetical protein